VTVQCDEIAEGTIDLLLVILYVASITKSLDELDTIIGIPSHRALELILIIGSLGHSLLLELNTIIGMLVLLPL